MGHLARTLAVAEEFDAHGHEVHVAMCDAYPDVRNALPPGIRVVWAPEMHQHAARHFGHIEYYGEGPSSDSANLAGCNDMDEAEELCRAERLMEMVEHDTVLVEKVNPDAIVTDYHYTALLKRSQRHCKVFHISHLLGYPSLCRRVHGSLPFPLDDGNVLVPGLEDIEYCMCSSKSGRETSCGAFRWRGWQRMETDGSPPRSDVFLFFGSTGNGEKAVPLLLDALPKKYRVSAIASGFGNRQGNGAYIRSRGSLQRYLEMSEVAICHGGHGTAMECIYHRTPMIVIPNNVEQLEIGRCMERLGLGILVKKPCRDLNGDDLREIIERVRSDEHIKARLLEYSTQLRLQRGTQKAMEKILQCLAEEEGTKQGVVA